jgi:hypothetical protein
MSTPAATARSESTTAHCHRARQQGVAAAKRGGLCIDDLLALLAWWLVHTTRKVVLL